MKNDRLWLTLAISVFFLGALAQCGGKKSKSDLAKFAVLPAQPIVITGDASDGKGGKLKGPWFSYRLNMTNGSSQPITIVAISVTILQHDATGSPTKATASADPTGFNFSVSETVQCVFSTFGTWNAGQTKSFSLENGVAACSREPIFYFTSGLSGASGKDYNYRVTVKPQGWFGTYDTPVDRFDTQFSFNTQ